MVSLSDYRTFVVADIPGIIEGAHEGKGLGHQFLRHIERTRTLAVMIPVDVDDPAEEYRLLRSELESYEADLAGRPHCVVFTKADLLGPDDDPPSLDAPDAWGTFVVSSVSRTGLDSLEEALWAKVREEKEGEVRLEEEAEAAEEEWWTP